MLVGLSAPSGDLMDAQAIAQRAMALLDAPPGRLAEYCEDLDVELETLRAHLRRIGPGATLEEFFPEEVDPHYVLSGWCGLMAALLRHADVGLAADTVIDGDLAIETRRVVAGNLVVRGHLHVQAQLVVLGDLVAGSYDDEYSATTVGGAMTADVGVYSMGMLTVVGPVRAPLVCLDFNQGFAKLFAGCTTDVLIESDHGGSRIFGPVEAQLVVYDELVTDAPPEQATAEQLESILHPGLCEVVVANCDEEGSLDHGLGPALWEALRSGAPLLAETG